MWRAGYLRFYMRIIGELSNHPITVPFGESGASKVLHASAFASGSSF